MFSSNILISMRILLFAGLLIGCTAAQSSPDKVGVSTTTPASVAAVRADTITPPQYDAAGKLVKIEKTNEQWKKELSAKEYNVLREEGTEYAFSGDLWNHHEKGTYVCRGCQLPLFSSATKFESGTGWPSFWQPIKPEYVTGSKDTGHGMVRDEVECARCGGHQGHVFEDGPAPTHLRYCINSASLDFVKE